MRAAAIEFLLQVKQCAKITYDVTGPEGRSRRPESLWLEFPAKSKVWVRIAVFSALPVRVRTQSRSALTSIFASPPCPVHAGLHPRRVGSALHAPRPNRSL